MENEIRIRVHSFCDIITNSSTTIFVTTHGKSIQMLKEFIDYLLKNAGSTMKAEDVFNFRIDPDEDWLEDEFEGLKEVDPELTKKIAMAQASKKGVWDQVRKLKTNYVLEKILNNEIEVPNTGELREDTLMIIPKNNTKDAKSVTEVIRQIFEIEEGQT